MVIQSDLGNPCFFMTLIRMPHNPNTLPGNPSVIFYLDDLVIRMLHNPNAF